ncbi:Rho GTPase activation protein [Mycotypha africana]|uniref:Rho GTPase activation protein n=1 Tax=Mycotypha africana TaxID=64632 RepID=UPI00230159F8|nr:Rho GTPase activation protein [Mycotypha africana]KAI8973394.1 Rho GTPase activation protein [Mycotypha africana]
MMYDEYITEKKKQKNLFGFLQRSTNNGKHQHQINNKKETIITRGIFGAPLKAASLCGCCTDIGLSIPGPVYRCFEEIKKRGLFTEGIFRLSGGAAEIQQLISSFDTPPTYGRYMDLSHYDIHAITCVVKKYLRQLPDPAIPVQFHDKFMQLYDEGLQIDLTTKTLGCLLQQLPKEHFHLIYYIILLCSDILKHADKNMMNSEALAVVFAPVCTGFEQHLKASSTSNSSTSWLNKRRHSPVPMRKSSSSSSSTSSMTTTLATASSSASTNTTSTSLSAAKLLTINYNNEAMSQCMEINAKWTRIWALLIEYNDRLLQLWKDIPLYDHYPLSTTRSSNGGHDTSTNSTAWMTNNTMPCLSPTKQNSFTTTTTTTTTATTSAAADAATSAATTMTKDHSLMGLHSASVVTMTTSMEQRGGDASSIPSDDYLLNIAPALLVGNKKATKKRHSLNNSKNNSQQREDDLYKVVVLRRPRQNSCSRALFNLNNSDSEFNDGVDNHPTISSLNDNRSVLQQQGAPPPVPPHTRTSSIANILRNSKRSLSRATAANSNNHHKNATAAAVAVPVTIPTIIVQPQ